MNRHSNSRFLLVIFLAVALIVTICPVAPKTASAAPAGFVTTSGGKFKLNGNDFYFSGTNNYYLLYQSQAMVDDVFSDAVAMNLKVLRMWGWINGNSTNNVVLQPSPGVFNEAGFTKMDYAIYKAGQSGIKLVIPFINNWDDFGGMNTYVNWFGAGSHDAFYTNAQVKQAYKNYVNYVLNRTNTYSGIKYKDDPTIMTWELANEPRAQTDKTGNTLVNWADEMSAYIKSLDPNHLVAVGDEGFYNIPGNSDYPYGGGEGVDWTRLIALPNIDYGTYHLYPNHWNETAQWGNTWIANHINDGAAAGKPVVLEEFGLTDPSTRDSVYATWLGIVNQLGGAGDQFWILTGIQDDGQLYPDYDGFRVVYPSATATLISNHAQQMNAKSGGTQQPPSAPTGVTATAGNAQVALSWTASSGATSYTVKRAATSGGPYTNVATGLTATSYSNTGLTNGTTYYYVVSAVNSVGESANSAQASATPVAGSTSSLVAQYKLNNSNATDNMIYATFNIKNTGTTAVSLSNVKLRYYFTKDGSANLSFWCDYAQVGTSSVSGAFVTINPAKTGADTYAEISFGSAAGSIAAGGQSGDIQIRAAKSDWSNFNEVGDYSFDGTKTSFADWNKVTLYQNGTLVWGIEP
ncbi:cellulose binding domain-containing protein [Cohnella herbarum]|uniref:cellulose binding domain-containing protein n=1 Tax=Cohnella herbarum TaxID=2728023 RepID=UPI0020C58269|nr:cellulose binding domain-containing protein [Cohnella herbarum]